MIIFACFACLVLGSPEKNPLMAKRKRLVLVAVSILAAKYYDTHYRKTPYHDSKLSGEDYYKEVMRTRSTQRFVDVTRMNKQTFIQLCDLLTGEGGLLPSVNCVRKVSVGEKVMIFIHCLRGLKVRTIAERFQHSNSTIHSSIYNVTNALLKVKKLLYKKPTSEEPIPEKILNNGKFYPYFKDCIGAFDGTHIHCIPPSGEESAFRNRKKGITQNVLAMCDFDMLFRYGHYGWEGSAHDGKVLSDALAKGFPYIPGKYYLADAGYGLRSYCLTPYRGVRYHLKEWQSGNQRPQNKEELFNLRHASLRNVIERIFGVIKKRFPILVQMEQYKFNRDPNSKMPISQIDLVECCFLLQNFIRRNQITEDEFYNNDDDEDDDVNEDERDEADDEETSITAQWRDEIAQSMWDDYVIYLQRNAPLN